VDSASTAGLFRVIAKHHPILLADECDTRLPHNEELRGLFNSGHRRNKKYLRCVGDNQEPRLFDCFTPKALGGLGVLPATMLNRSIRIRLERAKKGEIKKQFDLNNVEAETILCRKLARWIADNYTEIKSCNPQLPGDIFNRVADNWRPLFAIAQVAGGDWPKRCLAACRKLQSGEFEDVETLRAALLGDIQQIFAGTWPPLDEGEEATPIDRIFSKDLVEKLAEMKERPWPEVCRGDKPITERWLARNLGLFGIHSKNVRIGDEQAKGYELADFKDVFDRYVMPSNPRRGGFQASHRPNTYEKGGFSSVPKSNAWDGSESDPYIGEWDGGTDKKGDTPGKGVYDTPKEAPNPQEPPLPSSRRLSRFRILARWDRVRRVRLPQCRRR
jgi:hypothetical protein